MESMALGAIPAALNLTLKSAQAGFELQQAPKETRELFRTISSTRSDIVLAKEKRIELAKTCNDHDIAEWDRSIKELESALSSLEQLVEAARVDMQHNKGKVRLKTKALWVLRDSKSLSATNDRLSLAYARMNFCYQRLQPPASQPTLSREQKGSYEASPVGPPPPYQESTSKAVATRRREERERLERSESVQSISDTSLSSGSTTPTSPVNNGGPRRVNVLTTPGYTRRSATTSAVHLVSNRAHQHGDEVEDRVVSNASLQPPPLQPRSASMPYIHSNRSTHDRAALRPPATQFDSGLNLLPSSMNQLDISSSYLRNTNQLDPESMSIFSFEQQRSHSRKGSILSSTPSFKSTSTSSSAGTFQRTPDPPFVPTNAQPSHYQSASPQNPIRPSSNSATVHRQAFSQPPASSLRPMPPYPVSRNTTITQSRYHPTQTIPEDDERVTHPYDDMYDAPLPYPLTPPPPPPAPAPTETKTSPQPVPNSVAKTQHLFAGQRETKEIRYNPFFEDDENMDTHMGNFRSRPPPPPPPPLPSQKYQAYQRRFDNP